MKTALRLVFASLATVAALATAACEGEGSCFVAGTLVDTPDGPRAIETLAVGDRVYSYSHAERARVVRVVEATLRNRVREVRTLHVGDSFVRGVSPEHPFFDIAQSKYRPVRELVVGDLLAVFDGASLTRATLASVTALELTEPSIEVYNLTVEGPDHNYFVEGILVHNKSPLYVAGCSSLPTISPYAADDAGGAFKPGEYLVTVPTASETDTKVSIVVTRFGADHKPVGNVDVTLEPFRDGVVIARLAKPEPGHYQITATSSSTSPSDDCGRVASEYFEITAGPAVNDAGADADAAADADAGGDGSPSK